MYQSMSASLHLGKSTISWTHGVEHSESSLNISGELFNSSCISFPSSLQISCGIYCRSVQTCNSSFTLLVGGSLASQSSQHVRKYSSSVSYHKGSHHECVSWLGVYGSAVAAFNTLAAQICVAHVPRNWTEYYTVVMITPLNSELCSQRVIHHAESKTVILINCPMILIFNGILQLCEWNGNCELVPVICCFLMITLILCNNFGSCCHNCTFMYCNIQTSHAVITVHSCIAIFRPVMLS